MPNLRNGSQGDSPPGSLDCESGILRLSYRATRRNNGQTIPTKFKIALHRGSKFLANKPLEDYVWTYGAIAVASIGICWR